MKVFKFGGASVKNAERIHILGEIVRHETDDLIIVVSAMGKTTNELEVFTQALAGDDCYQGEAFDELYDQVVSCGELQSSRFISAYLQHIGIANQWLDMTAILRTDNHFRAATVDFETTKQLLKHAMQAHPAHVYVAQGFIGGTADGKRTTLGREGSDYTAAILANLTDAESVTLWKDVAGIYSADPRKVKDAVLLTEITYDKAREMAHNGAQIIHPETVSPLIEKNIPLYIRSFIHPEQQGTVIGN